MNQKLGQKATGIVAHQASNVVGHKGKENRGWEVQKAKGGRKGYLEEAKAESKGPVYETQCHAG